MTSPTAAPALSPTRRPTPTSVVAWLRRPTLPGVLLLGTAAVLLAMALTILDSGGHVALWENLHWTLASLIAVALGWIGVRRSSGHERTVRSLFLVAWLVYLGGRIAWDVQVARGAVSIPAPSDLLFLAHALPVALALAIAIRGRLDPGDELAVYLDALAVAAAIGTVIVAAYAPLLLAAPPILTFVTVAYPILFLGVAAFAIAAALAMRQQPVAGGSYGLALAFAILGLAWIESLTQSATAAGAPGSPLGFVLSFAVLLEGWSGATWTNRRAESPAVVSGSRKVATALPFVSIAMSVVLLLVNERLLSEEGQPIVEIGISLLVALVSVRQAILLRERTRVIAREHVALRQEREAREAAQAALDAHREGQQRYLAVVSVFNRLAEQITFAADQQDLIRSAIAALGHLVPTRHGDILLLNPSQDRLIVGVGWGWHPLEVGSAIDMESPLRCPGIRRGSVHHLENAADGLQLHCPAHPTRGGSLLCVPMVALGQVVGVVHLGRPGVRAFSEDDQRQAARVGEQIALALANLRLARSMENLAMTDSLTGLHNARFFEPFLERELAATARTGQPVGLLMLDIDHFKEFNDVYGHPAGDDSLRAFARTVLGTLRESDTVARYGGEEFIAALRGSDLEATLHVAEKVRQAVEALIIELGPGRYARITTSIGVASSASHGTDRRSLIRLADQALYQAKRDGRNRVASPLGSSGAHRRTTAKGAGSRPARPRATKLVKRKPVTGTGERRAA